MKVNAKTFSNLDQLDGSRASWQTPYELWGYAIKCLPIALLNFVITANLSFSESFEDRVTKMALLSISKRVEEFLCYQSLNNDWHRPARYLLGGLDVASSYSSFSFSFSNFTVVMKLLTVFVTDMALKAQSVTDHCNRIKKQHQIVTNMLQHDPENLFNELVAAKVVETEKELSSDKLQKNNKILASAIRQSATKFLNSFLEKATFSPEVKYGQPTLYLACQKGYTEIAKELLNRGANPNDLSQKINDWACLHFSAFHGDLNLVKWLIKKGAKVDIEGPNKETALYLACEKGHLEVVKELLSQGANPNQQDENGYTPFHAAASKGNPEITKLLIEYGASPSDPNQKFKDLALLHLSAGYGDFAPYKVVNTKRSTN